MGLQPLRLRLRVRINQINNNLSPCPTPRERTKHATMNTLLERTRRPDITFSRNGRISITARVVRLLSLQPGDSINIAFHLGECYLIALRHPSAVGRHIAQCHPTKKGSRNFCANSVVLARLMLDKCQLPQQRASFLVGTPTTRDGNTIIPIIFKNPIL